MPPEHAGLVETSSGIPVLGHSDAVREHVDATGVDIVFFTAGATSSSTDLRRLAWDLEDHAHVRIIVAPNVTDVSAERVRIRPVAGLPLMHLGRPRSRVAANGAKRAFDIAGASAILAVVGPVLLALMAWIRVHDGGSAIFRQTRVGRDGAFGGQGVVDVGEHAGDSAAGGQWPVMKGMHCKILACARHFSGAGQRGTHSVQSILS